MTVRLANVRPWAQSTTDRRQDFYFDNGVIVAIADAGTPVEEVAVTEPLTTIDGEGRVLLPSFTDAHAHLDSNRLDLPFRPHTASGSLDSLIDNDLRNWRTAEESVAWRAERYLKRTIASGTTLINTHAQVDPYSGLDRLEGILQAKANQAGRAKVRVIAFPQAGIVKADTRNWSELGAPGVPVQAGPGTTAALLEEALLMGADAVGGLDPCGYDEDPAQHLDTIFAIAVKHGRDLDIHLHERGSLGAFTMRQIIKRTRRHGWEGKVTISHAFTLTTQTSESERDRLLDELAEAGIAVTTVAPAGGTLDPRRLAAHGVRLGLGQDGMRDYWSPYGDADMLDRTWQMCHSLGLRFDDDIALAAQTASLGGRQVVDAGYTFDPHTRGLGVGDPADVVAIAGETVTSVIMDRSADRLVFHNGTLVSTNLHEI